MDFWGFLSALSKDWIGLMSGIASVILTIIGFFKKPKEQKKLFWIAGAVCFFLGSVRVWTNEHNALLAERIKNTPLFVGAVDLTILTSILESPDQPTAVNKTAMVAVISLINHGAPSVAYDYNMLVFKANGRNIPAQRFTAPDGTHIERPGQEDYILTTAERLDEKTSTTPIPFNGRQIGHLMFILDDRLENFKSAMGSRLVLTFKDSLGNTQKVEAILNNKIEGTPYIPGWKFLP